MNSDRIKLVNFRGAQVTGKLIRCDFRDLLSTVILRFSCMQDLAAGWASVGGLHWA